MKLTDEMLYENAAMARDLWLSSFPSSKAEVPGHEFSHEFERRMDRLSKKLRRPPRISTIAQHTWRAAVVILVLLGVTFVGVMTVQANRTKIIDVVTRVLGNSTHFLYYADRTDGEALLEKAVLNYLPEDMKLAEEENYDTSYYMSYKGTDNQWMMLDAMLIDEDSDIDEESDYEMVIDTEGAEEEQFSIPVGNATLFHRDQWTIIVWNYKSATYTLQGSFSAEEGKKIVENITYQEYHK